MNITELIDRFALSPHPEGGYFAETYRATTTVPTSHGERSASTAIYFLLPKGTKSHLHRIQSDEAWHFYLGGPLKITELRPDGKVIETVLGQNLDRGNVLQHVVPAGSWFGAIPEPGTDFSFVGCTVAPGFDFADFELADPDQLSQQYPHAAPQIQQLR